MSNIDKRALQDLATALDGDGWHAEGNSVYGGAYDVVGSVCYDHIASCESVNGESPLADFIASANPATVLALLDEIAELEQGHCGAALLEREESHAKTVGKLLDELEAAEKKAVEMPTFDGYVPHVARELQAAFRIACDNAGINIAAAGKGDAS
ncbi:ead/Ea22-like family protein [Enterobacter hormaechei]